MNKMDLLKEVEEMLYHNLLCYSKNYLRNEPKKEYVKEWEKTNEQIGLVKEIMKDIQQTISYQVRNGESDIIGSFCILNQAIAFAEKKKKEYVRNCDNSKVWVEIEGEEKEIYIAKGYTNEETEEFE